jgi:lysozyme family protein
MADFQKAEPLILEDEGVYSKTPGDDGGETCFGIDMASNPTWAGWPYVHHLLAGQVPFPQWHLDETLMGFVNAFYRALWNSLLEDHEKDQPLATAIFGGVTNQGPVRIIKWLQTCVCAMGHDVTVDGKLGQATVDACNACDPVKLLHYLKAMRLAGYIGTAAAIPHDRQFLGGWDNRLESGA